jgi:hypothetical protein
LIARSGSLRISRRGGCITGNVRHLDRSALKHLAFPKPSKMINAAIGGGLIVRVFASLQTPVFQMP